MTTHCTQQQSQALKEIGLHMPVRDCIYHGIKGDMNYIKKMTREYNHNDIIETTSLPTHAEALDWFREKRKLFGVALPVDDWNSWGFQILAEDCMSPFFVMFDTLRDGDEYPTHHQATSALVDKCIEITKEQKVFIKCSDCNTEFVSNQRCPECNPMG